MIRRSLLAAAVAVALSAPAALGEELVGFPYQWVEVSGGVYAALQPSGNRFNDSNSVVIVSASDVVVVDTQNYPRDNRLLIGKIRQVTDKPVRYVVNTHWHGDHTQGNAVYKQAFPDALVIGHPSLLEDIPARAEPQLEEQMNAYRRAIPEAEARLREGVDAAGGTLGDEGRKTLAGQLANARARLAEMEAVRFALPDLQVDDRLLLENPTHEIYIRHYRGHTRGDLVVFLPRQKILVTGDLLDDLPYGGHGYPRRWLATLDELARLDFELVIPGHGRIRQGKSHLLAVRDLFAAIVRAAEEASRAGKSLEELRAGLDLEHYRQAFAGDDPLANRAFEQFMPPTVERAWLEARGELED